MKKKKLVVSTGALDSLSRLNVKGFRTNSAGEIMLDGGTTQPKKGLTKDIIKAKLIEAYKKDAAKYKKVITLKASPEEPVAKEIKKVIAKKKLLTEEQFKTEINEAWEVKDGSDKKARKSKKQTQE